MIGVPTKEKKELTRKPAVDSFKIGGKLTGSLKNVAKMLSTISFLEVTLESNAINSAYVENRDINGKPYLFSLTKITKDEIEVLYSIPPTIAPKKRRIDVIRQLLNILNIISDEYLVKNKIVYNLIEKAIKDIGELVNKKTAAIYVEYDTLKNENKILKKKTRVSEKEISELKRINYELKDTNNTLALKVQKYETPSDEALKVRLQEWIKDHNGKINIHDFIVVHLKGTNVAESRVEQILNELVTGGHLTVKR